MRPSPELVRSMERERIERARRMHPIDKAFAGAALFDAVRERMMIGVLLDEPDATPDRVREIVRRRLEAQRERDEGL